jgi:hypothetical protein
VLLYRYVEYTDGGFSYYDCEVDPYLPADIYRDMPSIDGDMENQDMPIYRYLSVQEEGFALLNTPCSPNSSL